MGKSVKKHKVQKITRKYLIDLCDKAVVPYELWSNRDTPSAQQTVATARAYLKSGCKFRVLKKGTLKTDSDTIWVEIYHYEFEDGGRWHSYYIPTEKRLRESDGGDWY